MARPLQIGITGGIGAGKSLVCKIFACLGVPIYDADSRAKNLMTTDGILVEQIQKEFGSLSFLANGVLNRKFLAKEVFADNKKLTKLNDLVHPRVALDYRNWVASKKDCSYVLKEAALLFESGSYKTLDRVIVVHAPRELRIERVVDRDKHRTKEQVEEIMQKQLPETEKIAHADFVVHNDEKHLLIEQILKLHRHFSSLASAFPETH